jgi:hypothetical protein
MIGQAVRAAVNGSAEPLADILLEVCESADRALLSAAERALCAADVRVWLALDVAVRRRRQAPPEARLGQPLALVLASLHPSGYVREAAVAALADLESPLVPPVLALRSVDWVPQVRDRARASCERLLAGPAIVALAPLAFELRRKASGAWLAARVEQGLRDCAPDVLAAALAAEDRRTRRAAYTVALAEERLELDQVLRAASRDADPLIRIRCAETAIRRARAAGRLDVAQVLVSSRVAAVRAEALHALGAAGVVEPAERALVDRSALVRAVAQGVVRRGGGDPAVHYRALVRGGSSAPVELAGLGETGGREDADLLRPWLADPRPRVRVEAVRALRGLGVVDTAVLQRMLTDSSPAVVRQVLLSLREDIGALDRNRLLALLDLGTPDHVRAAAYWLLVGGDTWVRLMVGLRMLDHDDVLRPRALNDIRRWVSYEAATTYSVPGPALVVEFDALVRRAEHVLGTALVRELKFCLGLI